MKDYLGDRLRNVFPANPIQTRYLRFLQTPRGKLKSGFTAAVEYWNKVQERRKTVYEKYIGDL